jgi:hypothetical protein
MALMWGRSVDWWWARSFFVREARPRVIPWLAWKISGGTMSCLVVRLRMQHQWHLGVCGHLGGGGRLRSVATTLETTSSAVLTRWLRFVAFLLALPTRVAAGLGAVAKVSLALLGIVVVAVVPRAVLLRLLMILVVRPRRCRLGGRPYLLRRDGLRGLIRHAT